MKGLRGLIWKVLKYFLFKLDAEFAHRLTLTVIKNTPLIALEWMSSPAGTLKSEETRFPKVFGLEFRSRLGLAAGFDKDAELLRILPQLGFGFVEIGTVTPRPQPGNPKPRLFRVLDKELLFNRMGFNGLGAQVVSTRVEKAKAHLPVGFRIGVNIGKNKDTPLEDSARDYALAIHPFKDLADYVVINVSSPNTAGLRSLQAVEALRPIVSSVVETVQGWAIRPPLLLKLAPELTEEHLSELMPQAEEWGVDGWVLTNTVAGTHEGGSGGWSGSCLTEPSRAALCMARKLTARPIISVGGILTVQEARSRIDLGAQLVQIYTGWIFNGPEFPAEVSRSLQIRT